MLKELDGKLTINTDRRGSTNVVANDTRLPDLASTSSVTAGDVRRGQSLVVWAIREGRQAARAIDEALMGVERPAALSSRAWKSPSSDASGPRGGRFAIAASRSAAAATAGLPAKVMRRRPARAGAGRGAFSTSSFSPRRVAVALAGVTAGAEQFARRRRVPDR